MLTPTGTHDWRPDGRNTGIGQPVRRKEDLRLVTGQGCFSDDVNLPGQAYAVMLRSPHAHARIRSIDAAPALAVPGVIAVLTGSDLLADRVKPIPHKQWSYHPAEMPLQNRDGAPVFAAAHLPMPADKARFVGEALAMVIADTVAAAKDGAERVAVDYEPLPAVTDAVAAAAPEAPRLWEEAASNVLIDAEVGDATATAAAFARATHVVRLDTWIPRVTGVPMEPRAAVGSYEPATRRYTVHTGSGGAVRLKADIAESLDIPPETVRVVIRDVGGNFGTRGAVYPEFVLVAWAARRVGRPVKWTCERHESFVSDYQGRDLASEAELALDADGKFLAMRGSNVGNLGALTANFSMVQKGVEINSSIYRMPAACFRARCVTSNTTPTRPYRSSGRPEVMFVMERLIDLAARRCGLDRVEIRRRNLITTSELPYTNPFGMVYDSGDYHQVMDTALALSDWNGFRARRAEAKARGKRRGIGLANYIDTATGVPRERAEVTVQPDGFVDVVIGTVSNGQGHETSFAQLLTEWLGVPFERVRLLTGDTDTVKVGGGTHSGRGMRLASIIIHKATRGIIAKGARIAQHLLEAPASKIEFSDGRFSVTGTNRSVDLFEVASAALERHDLPDELRGALAETCDETINFAGYGYGSHVCEVEVDPDTGTVVIVRHTTVDDVGRAVNPLIIHGQTHGGIAQGVGQALLEQCFYDASTGQPVSGSFMDYALPRAGDFPFFTTDISEVPSTTHPLGIRPAGEGGTTPADGSHRHFGGLTVPLTDWGTLAFFRFDEGDSVVVEEPVDDLDIKSQVDNLEGGISHPIINTLRQRLTLGVLLTVRENETSILGQPFSFVPGETTGRNQATVWRLFQEYLQRWDRHAVAFRSTFSVGMNALGATPERDPRFPDSEFFAWLGQAQYAYLVTDDGAQLVLRGVAQFSDDPLLPLERIAVGGVGTVRGYRENHLVRDEGYSLSLEFRYPIIGGNDPSTQHRFTLIPFMDYGEAWNLDGESEALHSAGIGFNWEFRPLYAEFYYGYAINKPRPDFNNDLQDDGLHFQVRLDIL